MKDTMDIVCPHCQRLAGTLNISGLDRVDETLAHLQGEITKLFGIVTFHGQRLEALEKVPLKYVYQSDPWKAPARGKTENDKFSKLCAEIMVLCEGNESGLYEKIYDLCDKALRE